MVQNCAAIDYMPNLLVFTTQYSDMVDSLPYLDGTEMDEAMMLRVKQLIK